MRCCKCYKYCSCENEFLNEIIERNDRSARKRKLDDEITRALYPVLRKAFKEIEEKTNYDCKTAKEARDNYELANKMYIDLREILKLYINGE